MAEHTIPSWTEANEDALSSEETDKLLNSSGAQIGLAIGDSVYFQQLAQLGFGNYFQSGASVYDHLSPTELVNVANLHSQPQFILNIPGAYDASEYHDQETDDRFLVVKDGTQYISTSHKSSAADSDALFVDALTGATIDEGQGYDSMADHVLDTAIQGSSLHKVNERHELTMKQESRLLHDTVEKSYTAGENDAADNELETYCSTAAVNNADTAMDSSAAANVRKSQRIAGRTRRFGRQRKVPFPDISDAGSQSASVQQAEGTYNVDAFWCEDCQASYVTSCQQHKVQMVADKVVLTKAWASLPASLQIFRLVGTESADADTGELGVFAKRTLPKRSCFGPFIAEMVHELPQDYPGIMLKLCLNGDEVWLDACDEEKCNWMMFVRPAQSASEQNIVAFQHGQYIYYMTTKPVPPRTELKVWYASHYANAYGFALHTPETADENVKDERQREEEQESDGRWSCYECSEVFESPSELQRHLVIHDDEPIANDVTGEEEDNEPTRKHRGRRRRGRPRKMFSDKPTATIKEEEAAAAGSQFQSWKKLKTNLYLSRLKSLRAKALLQQHAVSTVETVAGEGGRNEGQELAPLFADGHQRDGDAEQQLVGDVLQPQGNESGPASAEQRALSAASPRLETALRGSSANDGSQHGNNDVEVLEGYDMGSENQLASANSRSTVHFTCTECPLKFVNEESLQQHSRAHATRRTLLASKRRAQCQVCKRRFTSYVAKLAHQRQAHGNDASDRRKRCRLCYIACSSITELQAHVAEKHTEASGKIKCTQCERLFDSVPAVCGHLRTVHPYRRFECEECHLSFNRADKLRLHRLRHTTVRDFMCETCGKQFKRKDKLKDHMRRLHAPDRVVRRLRDYGIGGGKRFVPKVLPTDYQRFIYKCQLCKLGFKRRGMLVNHLAKRHPDVSTTLVPELNLPILKSQRDYYCQYCDKVYKSSTKRKLHIVKYHPGLQLPACARQRQDVDDVTGGIIQNPSFSQTTGCVPTLPHSCEHCHKQYASKAKLIQHQRAKHPSDSPQPPRRRQRRTLSIDSQTLADLQSSQTATTPSVNVHLLHESLIDPGLLNMDGSDMDPGDSLPYVSLSSAAPTSFMDAAAAGISGAGGSGTDLLTQAMSELQQSYGDYRLTDTPRLLQHPTIDLGPTLTQVQFANGVGEQGSSAAAVLQSLAAFPGSSVALVTAQQPDGSTALNLTRIYLPPSWGAAFQ